jgi:hypothetical protein
MAQVRFHSARRWEAGAVKNRDAIFLGQKTQRHGKIEIAAVEILVEFVPGIQTFNSTFSVIIAVALLLKHITQTRIDQV